MLAVHRGRTALVAVLGVAILAGTGEALGRGEDRSWEVGAYAFNSSFDNSSNLDDALGFGVRAAYYIRALHALEIQVDQATADHISLPGVEIDVLKYSLNYLRNFQLKRTEKMAPFFLLGWGLLDADDGTGSDDSMVIRVGGGSRSFLTPHFALRIEGAMYHWNGD
ncbi:MAG TPA: outer membrane beta-barrel protein, partial [Candidatus Methylomirabilis sp.]|nr:outer membrane beta-barrel protein [Candidatus Methylomirabilis sp.]